MFFMDRNQNGHFHIKTTLSETHMFGCYISIGNLMTEFTVSKVKYGFEYINDYYPFAVNTINIFIECNEHQYFHECEGRVTVRMFS